MQSELISHIKLTPLRKEVLTILHEKNAPMGAYEILEELKKQRTNAEPPTVYRVLNFLVEKKLIHRIESQNTYVCCSQLAKDPTQHQAILFSCTNCQTSSEFNDDDVFTSIMKFSAKNQLKADDSVIEMTGLCQKCL